MEKTLEQYQSVVAECRDLFEKKLKDYGPAWRIFRVPSVTDQIYINDARIRTLQESAPQKVEEDEKSEFIVILNYSVIALIQLEKGFSDHTDLQDVETMNLYDQKISTAFELMKNKN